LEGALQQDQRVGWTLVPSLYQHLIPPLRIRAAVLPQDGIQIRLDLNSPGRGEPPLCPFPGNIPRLILFSQSYQGFPSTLGITFFVKGLTSTRRTGASAQLRTQLNVTGMASTTLDPATKASHSSSPNHISWMPTQKL